MSRVLDAGRAAGIGLLALAPLALPEYYLGILLLGLIYGVLAVSLDLVWGYGGVLTFGHAVFFGVGAYVAALTVATSLIAGVIGAVVGAGLLAVAIAWPLFRREVGAEYFAIITLAVAIVATQIARSWTAVTGGANGLAVGDPTLWVTGPLGFSTPLTYYVALAGLVGTGALAHRVVRSPVGTTLVGIAANERKARSLGYDPARYRAIAFGIAGAIAGLGGALYALHSGFVAPPVLGFELSTMALVWVLVGGRGTVIGPIAGAVLLTVFENLVSGIFVFVWTLLLGLTLVALVLALPDGLAGASRRLRARVGGETG